MTFRLIEADCITAMAEMEEASVDAIVTDPPYNLSFMGRSWDKNLNHGLWATEALRVLKPGGHLLAFGGTRTYHRLACALEDAGFEIRDCLAWLYGSGFPKSLDVSKAIDKAAGAEREVVGQRDRYHDGHVRQDLGPVPNLYEHGGEGRNGYADVTAPATPEAQTWQGWGTALKPAFEPIVLARKPLIGSVAQNVLEHGTGALNIDGTRIEADDKARFPVGYSKGLGGNTYSQDEYTQRMIAEREDPNPSGRWPANVLLDEEAAAMLDEQSGERKSAGVYEGRPTEPRDGGWLRGNQQPGWGFADSGGASRFFKVFEALEDVADWADETEQGPAIRARLADVRSDLIRFRYLPKADREERNRGLEHHATEPGGTYAGGDGMSGRTQVDGEWKNTDAPRNPRANHHPTVKPVELMQWLVRLITPPKGLVLDPFAGSGSTLIAACREGFDCIGIEREAEYVAIARDRIIGDGPLFNVEAMG